MRYRVTLFMAGKQLERVSFNSLGLMHQYVQNSGANALVECDTGEAYVLRKCRLTSSINAQNEQKDWVFP